ncbi:MAG: NAD-dependent epimerase/dehydratase family protein, partial [Chloroflexota bacterium]
RGARPMTEARAMRSDATAPRGRPGWIPSDADPVIREDVDAIVDACGPLLRRLSGTSLLITGGGGFVGRCLVESVLAHNAAGLGARCEITLLTRRPDILIARYRTQVDTGDVVVMTWGDRHSIDLPRRRWDYVIHAASPSDPRSYLRDPDRTLRDMVDMAASVAAAARASRVERLLLISSGAVYGDQPAGMSEIPEGYLGAPDLSRATSCYGEGKRVGELLFGLSGMDHRTARVFSLLGPYQDLASSFAVPNLIRQAATDGALQLTGDGSAVRSFCYAADLAVFLFTLLLGSPDHDTYNVGSREGTVTIGDVAAMVAEIFGGLEIRRGHEGSPAGRPSRYVPNLDRMYEVHQPRVGVREGLVRTCSSLYARGLISRRPSIGLDHTGARA